ncbi:MAG TPA: HlyD family efflux transporter periplasmic adaptor subunit [Pseudonocardiaceae bacterium]|jgi:HlyD family secretion protein|nr:HlyD family efflux transporter periplasmic adaptor subunit [Pseudonocardiaceae bacterium]
MAKHPVRVRGMNAAAAIGSAEGSAGGSADGEAIGSAAGTADGTEQTRRQQFPHASLRQLLVAVAILAIGALIAWFTLVRVDTASSFAGTVQPQQSVNLDFGQTGAITQVLVKPGEAVAAGQPLAVQDETAAKANLADAQAVLTADEAKLAALRSPTLSSTAAQTLALQVDQANGQLAGAQQAASDAATEANTELAQAQQAVTSAQATLNADSAQYQSSCQAVTTPPATCPDQQSQVQKDAEAVQGATADLDRTRAAAAQSQDSAANAVTNARSALALARNQQAAATAPAAAADISSAQADVAAAQTEVDQDSAALAQLTLRAPMAGLVADVNGVIGELDGTTGVHAFAGPQSLQTGSSPAFSLFPAQSGSGATQNSTSAGQQPLISLVTTQRNAVAQVSEDQVPALRPGAPATVTVNALKAQVPATVAQVIPVPVSQGGSVEYEVRLSVPSWPAGTEPGMSLSVVFG